MAEGDITMYPAGINALATGQVDLSSSDNHALTMMLLTSDYTPDPDLDLLYSSISANEYGSSDGYTAGGAVLQTTTWTYDSVNIRYVFDAADFTWSSLGPLATATPGWAVCYENGAAASDDHLIFRMELGTTATNGGDYTLTWSADGIFYSS